MVSGGKADGEAALRKVVLQNVIFGHGAVQGYGAVPETKVVGKGEFAVTAEPGFQGSLEGVGEELVQDFRLQVFAFGVFAGRPVKTAGPAPRCRSNPFAPYGDFPPGAGR
jgi:hypothetical protein